jgi:tetratricopeptide (TPR) repeat protein
VGTCRILAEIYAKLGEFQKAEAAINEGYNAASLRERSERSIFRLKRYHASIELEAGNLDKARELLTETIQYQENEVDVEEDSVLAISHALLGRVETLKGNYKLAQSELERALEVAKATQVKQDLAYVLQSFALLEEVAGGDSSSKAVDYAKQALALYRQLGMKLNIVETEAIIARQKEA